MSVLVELMEERREWVEGRRRKAGRGMGDWLASFLTAVGVACLVVFRAKLAGVLGLVW